MGVRVGKFPVRRAAARKFAMRACAAAVCSVFSLGALGQAAVDQARTAAGQAAIERAQNTGVLAGLDRALKTPLEIVWLRTAAEADAWNEATLSQAAEGCGKTATPKVGCAVVGRTAWRYVFGGNAQFAPRPNEVARLVVSSLNLPDAPMSAGKLELSGSGRLFIVTPERAPGARPTNVAVILAAGSTLQITDVASPSIQIELKAPEERPLLLGNIATVDIGKMLALMVKPGVVNASEASVSKGGRIALRSGGEIQLAALVSAPGRLDVAPAPIQFARVVPPAAEDFTPLAAGLETRGTKINTEAVLLASLAPLAGMAGAEVLSNAIAVRLAPPAMDFTQDFTQIAAVIESPSKNVSAEPVHVAAAAPAKAPAIITAALAATPAPAPSSAEIARMRAEIEAEIARDRERLAQPRTVGAPAAKRFVLGV